MEKRFKKLLSALENEFGEMEILKNTGFDKIREIRIRVGLPIKVITDENQFYINNKNVSMAEIASVFSALCEYSVHAFKNEICEGFITSDGGIRTGICGTAVYSDGKISNIKDISALNIRIPHEFFGISKELVPKIKSGGIIIIGPPSSGKTTFLRDFARISSKDFLVTVVDERMEISGTCGGIPSFDVGESSVLNGFYKSDGIKSAVRSMAPDIIICDEFGDESDLFYAFFAMKSGVKIVASMHGFDKKDFLSKPFAAELLEKGVFSNFVFINKKHEIYEILKAEDLLK